MASGPAGRSFDLPVTASCGDGRGAAVYRWRQQRQRQRRRGPGAGAQGVEKNHDVTAAGTEDFCLVWEKQHQVARPQELTHPGRGGCKCRGEQPSRLSRPASCRVPEPWKFIASAHRGRLDGQFHSSRMAFKVPHFKDRVPPISATGLPVFDSILLPGGWILAAGGR